MSGVMACRSMGWYSNRPCMAMAAEPKPCTRADVSKQRRESPRIAARRAAAAAAGAVRGAHQKRSCAEAKEELGGRQKRRVPVRQLVEAFARRRARQGQRPARRQRPQATHESGCSAAASAAPSLINRPIRSGVRRASASRREPRCNVAHRQRWRPCSVCAAHGALCARPASRSWPQPCAGTAPQPLSALRMRADTPASRCLDRVGQLGDFRHVCAGARGQRCAAAVTCGLSGGASTPCVFGSTPAPRSSAKISASDTPSCTDTSPLHAAAAPVFTRAQPAQARCT
jgi:hypothetical protein